MDYLATLERAIIYIENHLDEDIKVEDVAKEAGYSYYHLTRQFSAVLGESVGSYIKRRRLADAAKKLLYTDKRILDIAIESGFESAEAFSRAFKLLYKVSPITYRKNRLNLFVSSFDGLAEPFVGKVLHGGRYAVFTHKGSLPLFLKTFEYIWGTWFLSTSEVVDGREDFELYDERFFGFDHPDSAVDIYIPLK